MQYRRTPLDSGYSPSELLNGRQIRTKLDALVPSPAHVAQGKQAKEAAKSQLSECTKMVAKTTYQYSVGAPCYALYYGPKRNRSPRWIPAIVVKRYGTRSVNVRVLPRGPIWRRHIDQLRPRYGADQDADPGESLAESPTSGSGSSAPSVSVQPGSSTLDSSRKTRRPRSLPSPVKYGPGNPRRSERLRRKANASGGPSAGGEVL